MNTVTSQTTVITLKLFSQHSKGWFTLERGSGEEHFVHVFHADLARRVQVPLPVNSAQMHLCIAVPCTLVWRKMVKVVLALLFARSYAFGSPFKRTGFQNQTARECEPSSVNQP